MNRSPFPCGLIGLLATLLCAAETPAAFTVTDLGTLGGTQAQAFGINSAGQVVGQSTTGSASGGALHAFYYDGLTMQDLNDLKDPILSSNWTLTTAGDINDSGRIVGTGLSGSSTTGFLYNPVGHGVTPKAGTGNGGNQANALDNTGRVVGTSFLANNPGQTFAFATDGAHVYANGPHGVGNDINASGTTVGTSDTFADFGVLRAWMADTAGNVTFIDTLGGTQNRGYGINDSGWVVGESYTALDAATHAFRYDGANVIDLDTLGSTTSTAYAINNLGQVVGKSQVGAGPLHAFLYSSGTMTDLNTMIDPGEGWNLGIAWDINDSGQIVGEGTHNGQTRAFLLNPVPEPASGWVLLVGAGFLMRRRRNRA